MRSGGDAVGLGMLDVDGNSTGERAQVGILILPEHQRRGLGPLVLAAMEARAREYGRTVLQAWIEHAEDDLERVQSPTGFGSVPRDQSARFALRHGFALGQVDRLSRFALSAGLARAEERRAEAAERANGYRALAWIVERGKTTPEEWLEDVAQLNARMATDAPSGELTTGEERWTADRVRERDERIANSGRRKLVTAAMHLPSRRLVAFNELVVDDPTKSAIQHNTLVLREHRGHRLGMLVKSEGILRLRELAPAVPDIITGNAEENRPMLAVNEALGFTPIAYLGGWEKRLG